VLIDAVGARVADGGRPGGKGLKQAMVGGALPDGARQLRSRHSACSANRLEQRCGRRVDRRGARLEQQAALARLRSARSGGLQHPPRKRDAPTLKAECSTQHKSRFKSCSRPALAHRLPEKLVTSILNVESKRTREIPREKRRVFGTAHGQGAARTAVAH
jgi:hypothetical protein